MKNYMFILLSAIAASLGFIIGSYITFNYGQFLFYQDPFGESDFTYFSTRTIINGVCILLYYIPLLIGLSLIKDYFLYQRLKKLNQIIHNIKFPIMSFIVCMLTPVDLFITISDGPLGLLLNGIVALLISELVIKLWRAIKPAKISTS